MKEITTTRIFAVALAAFFIAPAQAQNVGRVTPHAFAIGKGAGITGYTSILCTTAQLAVGQSAADPICQTITGDASLSAAGALTFGAVNGNVGSFGSATQCPAFTVNAKGLVTASSATTCTPDVGSVTGFGTGVATALGVNIGSAGAFTTFNGALGTPSSGTGTNLTGLTLSGHAAQSAFTFVGNNTSGSASPTSVDIAALTAKASPASTDLVMISDQAASGAWKKVTVSSLASAGSVSSIAGNTGAFTLSNGIDNSGNQIQLTAARRTLPTTQAFLSGSGTYTTPANVLWIEVTLVGGGAGGAASVSGTAGTAGGDTCWNTTGAACTTPVYDAGGGVQGGTTSAGGTVSGSGTCIVSVAGGSGSGGGPTTSGTVTGSGGAGGGSSLGGAGGGSVGAAGKAAATNSGSGGGGGAVTGATNNGAAGGGGGATCRAIIGTPAATYTYAVGAAGTGGTVSGTGSTAGGNGAAGRIMVIEHYGS